MSNEGAVIVAKDMEVFLLLIYALGQLECVPRSWYVKTDSYQFLILTRFLTICTVNYLMLFPSCMVLPFVTPRHTSLRWHVGSMLILFLHNRDLSEYVIPYGSFDESFNYHKQSVRNYKNII